MFRVMFFMILLFLLMGCVPLVAYNTAEISVVDDEFNGISYVMRSNQLGDVDLADSRMEMNISGFPSLLGDSFLLSISVERRYDWVGLTSIRVKHSKGLFNISNCKRISFDIRSDHVFNNTYVKRYSGLYSCPIDRAGILELIGTGGARVRFDGKSSLTGTLKPENIRAFQNILDRMDGKKPSKEKALEDDDSGYL